MLLTPIFTNVFTKLTGQDPKDFRFKQGNVPLSQLHEVVFGFALYLTVVFSIQHIMKKHNPIRLKWLNFLHNCILCVGSAILVTLFMEIIIPMIYHHGFYYSICNPAARDPASGIEILYYINYLFKWYEFMDTVYLALKKKKLQFLHVYHHAFTMILCYVELDGGAASSWFVICLNIFIHVIMYYYYARTSIIKKPVWWKKHLTTFQITQFVLDLFVINFASYNYFVNKYNVNLPVYGQCYSKNDRTALVSWFLISSYLVLFIDFFIKTYKVKGKKAAPAKAKKAN